MLKPTDKRNQKPIAMRPKRQPSKTNRYLSIHQATIGCFCILRCNKISCLTYVETYRYTPPTSNFTGLEYLESRREQEHYKLQCRTPLQDLQICIRNMAVDSAHRIHILLRFSSRSIHCLDELCHDDSTRQTRLTINFATISRQS